MTQGTLDALADAETFLRIAQYLAEGLVRVDFGGLSHGYGVPKQIRMGHHNVAARYATVAARAAFRAVPGLRG